MPKKGFFIVIDGTDGSGKTVQATRLIERLRAEGREVEPWDFPRYGKPSAYFIERYLHGDYGTAEEVGAQAASILFAVERFDVKKAIEEKLAQGAVLISNRYVSANKGHQMGKITDPDEQVRFLNWLNDLEYGLFGIPKPDLTLLLHVTAEIGYELARSRDTAAGGGAKKDIHQNDLEHLRAAERAYLRLPEIDKAENWQVVECVEDGRLLPIETIHEKIWAAVSGLIG
jgi:dTMP kinase